MTVTRTASSCQPPAHPPAVDWQDGCMTLDRAAVARLIDHTLLKPEATHADVAALCKEATELGVLAVCVSPSMLPIPAGSLDPAIRIASVIGFPSGAHQADVKAAEAAE